MQNNWEKELGRALKESVGEPDAERMANDSGSAA